VLKALEPLMNRGLTPTRLRRRVRARGHNQTDQSPCDAGSPRPAIAAGFLASRLHVTPSVRCIGGSRSATATVFRRRLGKSSAGYRFGAPRARLEIANCETQNHAHHRVSRKI